eukprot:gene7079-17380_t
MIGCQVGRREAEWQGAGSSASEVAALKVELAAAATQIEEMKDAKKADVAEKKELAAKLAAAAELSIAKDAEIAALRSKVPGAAAGSAATTDTTPALRAAAAHGPD